MAKLTAENVGQRKCLGCEFLMIAYDPIKPKPCWVKGFALCKKNTEISMEFSDRSELAKRACALEG